MKQVLARPFEVYCNRCGVSFAAGTRSLYTASTVDQMPQHVASGLMWGDPGMFPLPDLDRTDYLLMLGANPWVSNGSLVDTDRCKPFPAVAGYLPACAGSL